MPKKWLHVLSAGELLWFSGLYALSVQRSPEQGEQHGLVWQSLGSSESILRLPGVSGGERNKQGLSTDPDLGFCRNCLLHGSLFTVLRGSTCAPPKLRSVTRSGSRGAQESMREARSFGFWVFVFYKGFVGRSNARAEMAASLPASPGP